MMWKQEINNNRCKREVPRSLIDRTPVTLSDSRWKKKRIKTDAAEPEISPFFLFHAKPGIDITHNAAWQLTLVL